MPHVIVKMYAGRSDEQKQALADAVTRAVTSTLSCSDAIVSVAIEDVEPERWVEDVYKADIAGHDETLFKKPGSVK